MTGKGALAYFNVQEKILHDLAHRLKVPVSEILPRVDSLMEKTKMQEQEISNLRKQLATGGGSAGANNDVKDIGGVKFIAKVLPDFPAKDLKGMADELKQKLGSGVVALIATNDGKASLVVGVTEDLTDKISAVDLVKVGAEALGGQGGGGRPDMAQAGGPDAGAANDAAQAIEAKITG